MAAVDEVVEALGMIRHKGRVYMLQPVVRGCAGCDYLPHRGNATPPCELLCRCGLDNILKEVANDDSCG